MRDLPPTGGVPCSNAADDADAGDPSRQDPLLLLAGAIRRNIPRTVWYGLAALTLLGAGIAVGVSIPPSPGTPSVEQGTVTWVNEGLPPPGGSGGPAIFLARLDGTTTAQAFTLANTVQWSDGADAGWQVPGTLPPIPACMVPAGHGRRSHDGFGPVRVHIKFGVLQVPMPDGELEDVAVWVECP